MQVRNIAATISLKRCAVADYGDNLPEDISLAVNKGGKARPLVTCLNHSVV